MPVRIPDEASIVPYVPGVELHAPPKVASVRAIVNPVQTTPGPAIAETAAFTVTAYVALQPVPSV
jgi:hypothetical protein